MMGDGADDALDRIENEYEARELRGPWPNRKPQPVSVNHLQVEELTAAVDGTGRRTQTRCLVQCGFCSRKQPVYRWSWAGHGFYKCQHCGNRVRYWNVKEGSA